MQAIPFTNAHLWSVRNTTPARTRRLLFMPAAAAQFSPESRRLAQRVVDTYGISPRMLPPAPDLEIDVRPLDDPPPSIGYGTLLRLDVPRGEHGNSRLCVFPSMPHDASPEDRLVAAKSALKRLSRAGEIRGELTPDEALLSLLLGFVVDVPYAALQTTVPFGYRTLRLDGNAEWMAQHLISAAHRGGGMALVLDTLSSMALSSLPTFMWPSALTLVDQRRFHPVRWETMHARCLKAAPKRDIGAMHEKMEAALMERFALPVCPDTDTVPQPHRTFRKLICSMALNATDTGRLIAACIPMWLAEMKNQCP